MTDFNDIDWDAFLSNTSTSTSSNLEDDSSDIPFFNFIIPDRSIPRVSADTLDSTTLEFVTSLGIDIEAFLNNEENNFLSTRNINRIVSEYGVFDKVFAPAEISIADIVGHDHKFIDNPNNGNNILHTFNCFFKRNGYTYHMRALKLLDYRSGEELLEGLRKRNNDTKDMGIRQIEDGKYVISFNGLHRFSVLRFFYLLDRSRSDKSEEELRKIYTIPVTLDDRVNFFKTYCNYIVLLCNRNIKHISFYNSSEEDKDKCTIFYQSSDERKQINIGELLSLAQESIDKLDPYSIYEITKYYHTIPSFKEFVDTNVPVLVGKINEEKGRSDCGFDRGY